MRKTRRAGRYKLDKHIKGVSICGAWQCLTGHPFNTMKHKTIHLLNDPWTRLKSQWFGEEIGADNHNYRGHYWTLLYKVEKYTLFFPQSIEIRRLADANRCLANSKLIFGIGSNT
jgi:hypothetical protein